MSQSEQAPWVADLLADGGWHAGPQLAAALGISRTAVNKQVQKARGLGLDIDSVRGRGYRLRTAFEPLRASRIAAELAVPGIDLAVLPTVDSTSAWLLRQPPAPGPHVCLAEHQSGGRGRRGRRWVSPYGANLYFSLAVGFEQTPAHLGSLSLAVGVVLAQALRGHGAPVQLKWPNDLIIEGAKCGGILIDHRGEVGGACRVVIGVGLNLGMRSDQAGAIDQPWAAIADHAALPGRNALAAQLLHALLEGVTAFRANGFAAFQARWRELDWVFDRPVTLDTGTQRVTGRADGVGADGALRVEIDGKLQRFYAGELSLRVVPGA